MGNWVMTFRTQSKPFSIWATPEMFGFIVYKIHLEITCINLHLSKIIIDQYIKISGLLFLLRWCECLLWMPRLAVKVLLCFKLAVSKTNLNSPVLYITMIILHFGWGKISSINEATFSRYGMLSLGRPRLQSSINVQIICSLMIVIFHTQSQNIQEKVISFLWTKKLQFQTWMS